MNDPQPPTSPHAVLKQHMSTANPAMRLVGDDDSLRKDLPSTASGFDADDVPTFTSPRTDDPAVASTRKARFNDQCEGGREQE